MFDRAMLYHYGATGAEGTELDRLSYPFILATSGSIESDVESEARALIYVARSVGRRPPLPGGKKFSRMEETCFTKMSRDQAVCADIGLEVAGALSRMQSFYSRMHVYRDEFGRQIVPFGPTFTASLPIADHLADCMLGMSIGSMLLYERDADGDLIADHLKLRADIGDDDDEDDEDDEGDEGDEGDEDDEGDENDAWTEDEREQSVFGRDADYRGRGDDAEGKEHSSENDNEIWRSERGSEEICHLTLQKKGTRALEFPRSDTFLGDRDYSRVLLFVAATPAPGPPDPAREVQQF
jgi:hypothetical protein